ncbi:MAG: hypothetical protein Q9222_000272 [Ikaeria aurantiellina]
MHREELLRHVNLPLLKTLIYAAPGVDVADSLMLLGLRQLRNRLDIEEDPYVKALRAQSPGVMTEKLSKVLLSRKTYCRDQLKNLHTRAEIIQKELGPWATDWYIAACVRKLQQGISESSAGLILLEDSERIYLGQCLGRIQQCVPEKSASTVEDAELSDKVLRLVDFLVSEQKPGFTGLVFVQTRAEVAVLSQVLSVHLRIKDFYTVSTFVGASSSSNRKGNIGELVDVRDQIDTLDDLRYGRRNLVVTTSALEEGIDVSACNTVICFDKPANLRSLVQRRGRARKSESTFALMLADNHDPSVVATWQRLEEEMRQIYQDDMRQLLETAALEAIDEGDREYVVEKTGARLHLSDAVSHLYHFCATLPLRQYANPAPVFIIDQHEAVNGSFFTAKLILPLSVDASVREAHGRSTWSTEKGAKRDVAFEAYLQLYHAGLITDNLLPVRGYDEAIAELNVEIDKVPSLVDVAGQLNPWYLAARQWQGRQVPSRLHRLNVSLQKGDETMVAMQMLLPCVLPKISPFALFWDASTTIIAAIQASPETFFPSIYLEAAAQSTTLLLSSVFRSRMTLGKSDHIAIFVPAPPELPSRWTETHTGTIPGNKLMLTEDSMLSPSGLGIAHDLTHDGVPYIVRGVQQENLDDDDEQMARLRPLERSEAKLLFEVSRYPKRTDFLHPVPTGNRVTVRGAYKTFLRPEECSIDRLHLSYAYFASMVPAVLHHVGVRLVAAHLSNTLVAPVAITDTELLVTAINTPAARESSNYQRQEFLGDSVLKFLTSVMLMSGNLTWHEGVLSRAKDHIVSNASLAKAALASGLDSFILTEPFTGTKWRPIYVSESLKSPAGESRQISTKTLADVVEALVGAAFLDGNFDKALGILEILLPDVSWSPLAIRESILFSAYDVPINYPSHFSQLEQLIGYEFKLKALPLEALTHPSYIGSNVSASYERLEFLGDVCLDIIVASTSFKHGPPLPTHRLHLVRTAVVNAHFLAFLCLTMSISLVRTNVVTESKYKIVQSESVIPTHIWEFMRHAAPTIRKAQRECVQRYEVLETPILESLEHGSCIPWALLARLDAPKFFSDIIESIIGAIYIDSHGSLAACETFLERSGVMGYLRRLLQENMELYHPKEELGQLADTESVRYEVFRTEGGENEEKKLGCVVMVGEREVARVGDGVTVLEVKTRAAEEAVRFLKEEQGAG